MISDGLYGHYFDALIFNLFIFLNLRQYANYLYQYANYLYLSNNLQLIIEEKGQRYRYLLQVYSNGQMLAKSFVSNSQLIPLSYPGWFIVAGKL